MKRSRKLIGAVIAIVLIVVFVLAIIFLLSKNTKSEINNEINLEAKIADGGNSIELSIINHSSDTITCGLDYEIQIYKGTEWETCPSEMAFDALGIEILPNKLYVQNIALANEDIDRGETYRIKKVIDEYEYYSNEFMIE